MQVIRIEELDGAHEWCRHQSPSAAFGKLKLTNQLMLVPTLSLESDLKPCVQLNLSAINQNQQMRDHQTDDD